MAWGGRSSICAKRNRRLLLLSLLDLVLCEENVCIDDRIVLAEHHLLADIARILGRCVEEARLGSTLYTRISHKTHTHVSHKHTLTCVYMLRAQASSHLQVEQTGLWVQCCQIPWTYHQLYHNGLGFPLRHGKPALKQTHTHTSQHKGTTYTLHAFPHKHTYHDSHQHTPSHTYMCTYHHNIHMHTECTAQITHFITHAHIKQHTDTHTHTHTREREAESERNESNHRRERETHLSTELAN